MRSHSRLGCNFLWSPFFPNTSIPYDSAPLSHTPLQKEYLHPSVQGAGNPGAPGAPCGPGGPGGPICACAYTSEATSNVAMMTFIMVVVLKIAGKLIAIVPLVLRVYLWIHT